MILYFLLKYPDIASLSQSVEKGLTEISLVGLVKNNFSDNFKFERGVVVCRGNVPYGRFQKQNSVLFLIFGMNVFVKSTEYPYHRSSDSVISFMQWHR